MKKSFDFLICSFFVVSMLCANLSYASTEGYPSVWSEPAETSDSMSAGTKWLIGGALAVAVVGGIFAFSGSSSNSSDSTIETSSFEKTSSGVRSYTRYCSLSGSGSHKKCDGMKASINKDFTDGNENWTINYGGLTPSTFTRTDTSTDDNFVWRLDNDPSNTGFYTVDFENRYTSPNGTKNYRLHRILLTVKS